MPRPTPRPAGFTLIEMLVAIAIISALIGIGVVGINGFYASAQTEGTRVLLQQLAGIETEYRAQSNGQFPGDDPSVPANTNPAVDTSIEWFIAQAAQYPATEKMMLETLNNKYYTAPDGTTPGTVIDTWDNPVEYIAGSDGTTAFTTADGSSVVFPLNSTPFFASAGPDGEWGSYATAGGGADLSQPDDEAKDNLYSFQQQ